MQNSCKVLKSFVQQIRNATIAPKSVSQAKINQLKAVKSAIDWKVQRKFETTTIKFGNKERWQCKKKNKKRRRLQQNCEAERKRATGLSILRGTSNFLVRTCWELMYSKLIKTLRCDWSEVSDERKSHKISKQKPRASECTAWDSGGKKFSSGDESTNTQKIKLG